jgi:2-oxoglutarate ferredoxin oxidoreductase subunit delta
VKRYKKGHVLVEITESFCKGCDICIEFCPTDVFEKSGKLNRKGYYVPVVARVEDCTGCLLCDLLCPEMAIVITDEMGNGEAGADEGNDD